MLINIPIADKTAHNDEPPYDRKNKGIPVIGITPIAMPILTNTWKNTIPTIPAAIYEP